MGRKIKRCKKCALPSSYPGIKFNKSGICNYCIYHELTGEREKTAKKRLKKEFVKLIKNIKGAKQRYDCIVAYSGGKDSTFLLNFLKTRFGLKILAHTFDNGFISPVALKNIRNLTRTLSIEHKFTRPDFELLKEVFNYAITQKNLYPREILAMMSPVCAVCLGMVFGTTINLAIKLKIPLMFIGFTPGQYPAISLENFFKVESCIFLSEKVYRDDPMDVLKIIADPIREKYGEKISKYYFKSQYLQKGVFPPKILFPFHGLLDYDEKEIIEEIEKLGWVKPKDTDLCSTNCLLNSLGNFACLRQYGYHPYSGELGYLVRIGKLTREQALNSAKAEKNSFALEYCLQKLRLKKKDIMRL